MGQGSCEEGGEEVAVSEGGRVCRIGKEGEGERVKERGRKAELCLCNYRDTNPSILPLRMVVETPVC